MPETIADLLRSTTTVTSLPPGEERTIRPRCRPIRPPYGEQLEVMSAQEPEGAR